MKGSVAVSLIIWAFLAVICCTGVSASEPILIINGDKIYSDEFNYDYNNFKHLYSAYLKLSPSDVSQEAQLKQKFINDLIDRQLLVQEGRKKGISAKVFAGEEEIEEYLTNEEGFKNNGVFDPTLYASFESNYPKEYKKLRDRAEDVINSSKIRSIVPSKVMNAIKEEISPEDSRVLDQYLKSAEKIKIKYYVIDPIKMASNSFVNYSDIEETYRKRIDVFGRPGYLKYASLYFDPADYIDMASVSDNMAREYYDNNLKSFMTPSQVKVKYAVFKNSDHESNVFSVGVNVKAEYEENKENFFEPASARVFMISMKKPYDVQKLMDLQFSLNEGVTFEDLAKQYSDDQIYSTLGGDMGYISEGSLKEPFNSLAFSLSSGQVSRIIETDSGYYVFRIIEKKLKRMKTFEDVRIELEQKAIVNLERPYALADAKRFRVEALRTSFEAAAERKNLAVFETDFIIRDERIPTIGINTIFNYYSFALPKGGISDVIDYPDGYYVLKVDDIRQPDQKQFDVVRDDIKRQLEKEASWVYAQNAAHHASDLILNNVPVKDIPNRMNAKLSYVNYISTFEAPSTLESVTKNNDGYRLSVFLTAEPAYLPPFNEISNEVAVYISMSKADDMAHEMALNMLNSNWITFEGVVDAPLFKKDDYLIGDVYLRPVIEKANIMRNGESNVVKFLNKYYLIRAYPKTIQVAGREEEDNVIKERVLKEIRQEHLDEILKREKNRAEIKINI